MSLPCGAGALPQTRNNKPQDGASIVFFMDTIAWDVKLACYLRVRCGRPEFMSPGLPPKALFQGLNDEQSGYVLLLTCGQ